MRGLYHSLLDALFRSAAFRERLKTTVRENASESGLHLVPALPYLPNPYAPRTEQDIRPLNEGADQKTVIFITSRFRSGSTLLWNIFHTLEEFTSYYEPLNERQWFLPSNASHVDPTHRGAANYHVNYENMEDLKTLYHVRWIDQDLIMHAQSYDWGLKRYLDALIERADKMPVLQFNRMDFRLPWLKAAYPHAKILHLYRNPRDQWISMLYGQTVPRDITVSAFHPYDRFYLLPWFEDIRRVFTCLDLPADCSAYEVHYLIWRLSYLYGSAFGDVSLSYEDLIESPLKVMSRTLESLSINHLDVSPIDGLIDPTGKSSWHEYADEAWFAEKEQTCEEALSQMLALLQRG